MIVSEQIPINSHKKHIAKITSPIFNGILIEEAKKKHISLNEFINTYHT